MEHWDPQMMLNLYIHNYMIRKDMRASAEIFAREANFYPRAVAINPPEGFLSEWWSLFWSVYSSRLTKNPEATEGSSSKASETLPDNTNLVIQSPDVSYMLRNTWNMPWNMPQSNLLTLMLRSESRFPISDFSVLEGQTITNFDQLACMLATSSNSSHPQEKVYDNPQLCFSRDIGTSLRRSTALEPIRHSPKAIQFQMEPAYTDSRIYEQVRLGLPVSGSSFSSQILDVNQLARVLPSSNNYFSHHLENVYKKPLFSVAGDGMSDNWLRIPTGEEPTYYPAKAIQLKREPIDTDARMFESEHHVLPVKNLNSNSQLLDVDLLAPFLPSPSKCGHPLKNKKRQGSVTRNNKYGSSVRRSAANPTPHASKAIQPKKEPSDADGIIREQEHLRLPVTDFNSNSQLLGVDQIARLLSSSSNCSLPPKNVNKNGHRSVTRDDKCASSSRRSTTVRRTRRIPRGVQRKREFVDNGLISEASNSTVER